jgi:hypothetical protein
MLRVRSEALYPPFDTEVLAENLDLELDIHLQTFNVINTPETLNSNEPRIRRTENDRILGSSRVFARKGAAAISFPSRILK